MDSRSSGASVGVLSRGSPGRDPKVEQHWKVALKGQQTHPWSGAPPSPSFPSPLGLPGHGHVPIHIVGLPGILLWASCWTGMSCYRALLCGWGQVAVGGFTPHTTTVPSWVPSLRPQTPQSGLQETSHWRGLAACICLSPGLSRVPRSPGMLLEGQPAQEGSPGGTKASGAAVCWRLCCGMRGVAGGRSTPSTLAGQSPACSRCTLGLCPGPHTHGPPGFPPLMDGC